MRLDPHDNERFWDLVDQVLDADDDAGGGAARCAAGRAAPARGRLRRGGGRAQRDSQPMIRLPKTGESRDPQSHAAGRPATGLHRADAECSKPTTGDCSSASRCNASTARDRRHPRVCNRSDRGVLRGSGRRRSHLFMLGLQPQRWAATNADSRGGRGHPLVDRGQTPGGRETLAGRVRASKPRHFSRQSASTARAGGRSPFPPSWLCRLSLTP